MTTYLAPSAVPQQLAPSRVRTLARAGARWINRLLFATAVLQFYSAGLAIFGGTGFGIHAVGGWLTQLLSLLTLLMLLVARTPFATTRLALVLLLLAILQPVLAFALRATFPFLSALHPVNGLAMLVTSVALERRLRSMA